MKGQTGSSEMLSVNFSSELREMPDDSQFIPTNPSGMTNHVGSGELKVKNIIGFPHKISADPQSNPLQTRRDARNRAVNK